VSGGLTRGAANQVCIDLIMGNRVSTLDAADTFKIVVV
jgi:hypothetical protein